MKLSSKIPPLLAGDAKPGSFRALFTSFYPGLVYFSYRLVSSRSEAEDIAQESFARYWSHRESISTDERSVKGYLYETARNLSFNFLRHRAVERVFLQGGPPTGIDDEGAMVSAEALAAIYKALDSLPTRCREIASMAYLEGIDNREIARRRGLSVNTVRAQKHRAIQLLRARLDRSSLLLLLSMTSGENR
jgi:RNA polymerase sigma-70 factor (ECF subfamily)